jgi:phosphomethylpyrimidine synthase
MERKTQLEEARSGNVTAQMKTVAENESISEEKLMDLVARGHVVIPANHHHSNLEPIGIGKQLRTKINANIGTSCDYDRIEDELKKLDMVVRYRADTVMDLSTGGDITEIRRAMIKRSTIPFGNVPVYQMSIDSAKKGDAFVNLTFEEMAEILEIQAGDGVDYMTVHAGLTMRAVEKIKQRGRVAGIVSRGGALITGWMVHNQKDNPFYVHFDRILEIAKRYDVTLSLGDGLRPGALADGSDWGQMEELLTLGELVKRSREAGVQVMVEGPGHLPINQIQMNIELQKSVCDHAPFYVLGPIVTDIAPGYDHITSAIGGAIAASHGADFLCYVTPSEHLGLPDVNDVKDGIMASRIAAHAADIAKGVPGAVERDNAMGKARKELDWEKQKALCLDRDKFDHIRKERHSETEACSMCGSLCVYKVLENII